MVFHLCEFFHVASKQLMLCICSHTVSRWMVYHHCGFFHVSLRRPTLCICSHIGNSWTVSHQYVLSNVFSSSFYVRIPLHILNRWISCFLQSYCVHLFGDLPFLSVFQWVSVYFNRISNPNKISNVCCSYFKRGAIKEPRAWKRVESHFYQSL